MARELNIYVSSEDFRILQESSFVLKNDEDEDTENGRNSFAGLNRVVM